MQKSGIPGLRLAIVKNGKIIKTANYRRANVLDSIPVSDQTVFTINVTGLPENWKAVTIQQLLPHTSGTCHQNDTLAMTLSVFTHHIENS